VRNDVWHLVYHQHVNDKWKLSKKVVFTDLNQDGRIDVLIDGDDLINGGDQQGILTSKGSGYEVWESAPTFCD
jgi:hypothetical protein